MHNQNDMLHKQHNSNKSLMKQMQVGQAITAGKLLAAASILFVIFHTQTDRSKKMSSSWPRVLLFGDSLTQFGFSSEGRWVSLLADSLQRRCDVVVRGFAGYNTRNFLDQINGIVSEDLVTAGSPVAAATIFLGANDANDPEVKPSTNQHVPLEDYEENIRLIISHIIKSGISKDKLIVIPPPPNDPDTWKSNVESRQEGVTLSGPPKNNDLNRKYYDICVAVAKETGCEVLELWDHFVDKPKHFSDGLHFSAEGSEVLFRLLWPMVDKRCPKEDQLPGWRSLNLPE